MILQNLLLEIITEDLPYNNSQQLILSFVKHFVSYISKKHISYKTVEWELTYRRIVLKLYDIKNINYSGVKNNIYKPLFPSNNTKPTKPTNNIIHDCIKDLIINSIKKSNNFQKGMILHEEVNKRITFIRPIKNFMIILNHKLIRIHFLNLRSTRYTYSNKFIKNNLKIKIYNFHHYDHILYDIGKVIINYQYRKEILLKQLKEYEKINQIHIDYSSLIEEVMFLKEFPFIIQSSFKKIFLNLPQELLIFIIKHKQKSFPVYSKDNQKILPLFFTVINIPINNDNKTILTKNFRDIVNNLLTEIEFFFLKDRKKRLRNYLEDLKYISLEDRLGNLFDKTQRIKILLCWLSKIFSFNKETAKSLALLSLCDLSTLLVQEYPELRGLIGMCYSKLDNEEKEVYQALKAPKLQLHKSHHIENPNLSCCLSFVDTLDDVVGLISIHFKNKKIYLEQDPYEIRRKTISLIHIIVSFNLNIDLLELIEQAKIAYTNINNFGPIYTDKITNFIYLKYISWAHKYYAHPLIITSVTNIFYKRHNIFLLHQRIQLLHKYFNTPYLNKIIEIYKRINNLLNKVDIYNLTKDKQVLINTTSITDPLVKELWEVILTCKRLFHNQLFNNNDENNLLLHIYKLSIYMEKFLNNIKIFIDNVALSNQRIFISITVKNLMLKLADFNILLNK